MSTTPYQEAQAADTTKEMARSAQPSYHGVYHGGLEVAPDPPPQQQMPKEGQQYYPYPPPGERTILGMRRTTFFLSVALLIVVIAAAIAGGVGGSIAVQNAKSAACASTAAGACAASAVTVTATIAATGTPTGSSPTSTASGLVVPTGLLALDCPNLDTQGQQIVTLGTKSWRFTPLCGVNIPGNDIGAVIVYSYHDCLQACAAHNNFSGKDECVAVHFDANQKRSIPTNYGNCWIKRSSDRRTVKGTDDNCGGVLVSSG